ncbi:MAG TPA: zf-TFIIB domain-containing protein [Candidatus Binataceae bacterium]|nr:zf-TFIIB domain-containing protein [Candidatus Binataceae bacterium]
MSDEKDRLGQKLHDVEKAREDQWAREEDARLIERMRQRHAKETNCPECGAKLAPSAASGLAMMKCPNGHGAWLDKVALEKLHRLGG